METYKFCLLNVKNGFTKLATPHIKGRFNMQWRRNNVPTIFNAIYWMKRMWLWQISVEFYVGIVIIRRGLEGSCREPFDTQLRTDWGKHKRKFDSAEGFDISASWVEVRRLITWSFWWVRRLPTLCIVKSYWFLFWLTRKYNFVNTLKYWHTYIYF